MAPTTRAAARRAQPASVLLGLSDDELEMVFEYVCSIVDPRPALALSPASRSVRRPVQPALLRLRARHEAARAVLA